MLRRVPQLASCRPQLFADFSASFFFPPLLLRLVSATFRFDDRMQADVVRRLVLCLDDANHEVQNMAVQW